MPLRILIFSEYAINHRHGGGVQTLRSLEHPKHQFYNINHLRMFGSSDMPSVELTIPECCYWLDSPKLHTRLKASALYARYEKRTVPELRKTALRDFPEFDLCYVFSGTEPWLRAVVPLLQSYGKPFVAQMSDLQHVEGLDPKSMDAHRYVLQNAAHVFSITENLSDELRKFGVEPELLPPGQLVPERTAQPRHTDEPLRVLIMGSVNYPVGFGLLAEAWPGVQAAFPGIELHYAGFQFDKLPAALQPHVTSHGLIQQPEVLQQLLTTMHVAYLPGPSDLDWLGKYSFPSRSSDFFLAGLPTVACIREGTATYRVFQPLFGIGVAPVQTADELIAGLGQLTRDTTTWTTASQAVRRFGEENLDIRKIRGRIFEVIEATAARGR